ncbi:hypothetical protein AAHA92_17601 [Salvia divinorum]|uniref:Uncharacterized protein n=1 Tax=Salvia divinorum TaxID=28513 RepID=A0ABD1GZE6_SALDI
MRSQRQETAIFAMGMSSHALFTTPTPNIFCCADYAYLTLTSPASMDVDHCKKPSFLKCFSLTKNMDSIRLPPEWVSEHGDELPYECSLVMPNDVQWTVRLMEIGSRCYVGRSS